MDIRRPGEPTFSLSQEEISGYLEKGHVEPVARMLEERVKGLDFVNVDQLKRYLREIGIFGEDNRTISGSPTGNRMGPINPGEKVSFEIFAGIEGKKSTVVVEVELTDQHGNESTPILLGVRKKD